MRGGSILMTVPCSGGLWSQTQPPALAWHQAYTGFPVFSVSAKASIMKECEGASFLVTAVFPLLVGRSEAPR